jgi:hypothetical protein
MLTLRDLGAAAIKLIGVSYLAQAIVGLFTLLAMFLVPMEADVPGAREILPAQLMGTFGLPAAAIALIGGGNWLAERLLPPTPVGIALDRLYVLVVALVAVGVALVASSLPTLVQAGGTALWYAEASRQAFADAWFERQWPEVIRAGLELTVGVVLALVARPVASWLDARSQ